MQRYLFKLNKKLIISFIFFFSYIGSPMCQANNYETEVAKWTSYEDVAKWLDSNFVFDHDRLNTILKRTAQSGPSGLLARNASSTFEMKKGYCTDSAKLAIDALNRINFDYNANYIFIKNKYGQPHHWVTGFTVNGKIMVMDYGAGPEWKGMKGVHGPYDSLSQYADFLSSLQIRKFSPEVVRWLDMPGQED